MASREEGVTGRMPMPLIVAVGWSTVALVFATQEYVMGLYVGQPASVGRVALGVFPHYVLWALMAIPIVWLCTRFPIESPRIAARVAAHFGFTFVFYVVDISVSAVLMPRLLGRELTPFRLGLASLAAFYDDFLLYWGIVGVNHLMRYQRRLSEEQARRAELQREFAVAQLNVLRAQLQPHFLFNTLNSISELMHVDVDAAERMTDSLSSLLRSSLECDAQQIPLSEELAMLDVYLDIQQVRFSDSVSIERSFASDAMGALVPTLFLQPLVENAFRHGMSKRKEHGVVAISARREGHALCVEVRDNGSGVAARPAREGIGLRNTRDRLERLYGEAQSLSLEPAEGGGTRVRVTIPFRDVDEERVAS